MPAYETTKKPIIVANQFTKVTYQFKNPASPTRTSHHQFETRANLLAKTGKQSETRQYKITARFV